MKKSGILYFFLLTAMMLFINFDALAQRDPSSTIVGNKVFYTYTDTVMSASDTTVSAAFNLNSFIGQSWTSNNWICQITTTVPTTGTPKNVFYIQNSFYPTTGFANVDTLKSTDSTYTAANITSDFGGNLAKKPFWRWVSVTGANSADTSVVKLDYWQPAE